jgi:hypothetical protein
MDSARASPCSRIMELVLVNISFSVGLGKGFFFLAEVLGDHVGFVGNIVSPLDSYFVKDTTQGTGIK